MLLILTPALITDPSQWPGFSDLAECAQASIVGCYGCYTGILVFGIDCSTWVCACDHFSAAMSEVSSVAASSCTNSQDVASATSVWNGFCAQLSATPTGPTAPTQTGTTTSPVDTGTVMPSTTGSGGGNNGSGGNGLSKDARVGLAAGLGVGIPAIVIALLAWWFPCRRRG